MISHESLRNLRNQQVYRIIEAASSSHPIRLARIKARRELELLCLIENQLDWYDADEVDNDGLDIPEELSDEHDTPFLGEPSPIWIIVKYIQTI